MRSRRLAAVVAFLPVLGSVACGRSGEGASAGSVPLEIPSGVQPIESIALGAGDRVRAFLLTALPGLDLAPQNPEYSDGVASTVCGNKRGPEAYGSIDGMRREWRGSIVTVRQFVGVFGAVTAEQAVEQVASVLDCGSYQDREGKYTGVHRITVSSADLAFCEILNGTTAVCTGMVARQDILVRIQASAANEMAAVETLGEVLPRAAEVLAKAW